MNEEKVTTMRDQVFKFGCRAPRDPAEREIAEQLLGQAWLYREDVRRAYNANKRAVRDLIESGDAADHVRVYEHLLLNQRIREARTGSQERQRQRGHLIDAGTYWLIEADMLRAMKKTKLDPIRQRLFNGTGRIGAAIQSTDQFPASRLNGGPRRKHGRRIENNRPVHPRWRHPRVQLSEPNERGFAVLTIFVGELTQQRAICWPIKIHRPWPEGAIVKQIAVQRTRVGQHWRWEALFTISAPRVEDMTYTPGSVVGIDIGWRNEGVRGLRVATHDAADDMGEHFVDVLTDREMPKGTRMADFLRADSIRAIRDDLFNQAKEYVAGKGLPGTSHVMLWKNKDRLRRLKNDDVGIGLWASRDKHLEDIECGQRARSIRRRLDGFRVYADRLAKQYEFLALEDMPIEIWVGKGATKKLERQRSAAALGLLQLVLIQRFGSDRIDWVPSERSSMTCGECGVVRPNAVGAATHWTCECGREHHQDVNAARVLRMRCERWIHEQGGVRARKRKAEKSGAKPGERDILKVTRKRKVVTSRKEVSEAAE